MEKDIVNSGLFGKTRKFSLNALFPAFLVLAILILGIFTFVVSSGKQSFKESEAFVQGLLTPPTNPEIVPIVDDINREVDLKLTWEEDIDYEIGYAIYWYIEDYTTGLKKVETPNITEAVFYSIPCTSTQVSYYMYVLLSAYSADDASVPATTEQTVIVPPCSDFGTEPSADPWADINRDKKVDILDYTMLFENYDLVVTKDLMCEIVE
jgi:hypothetical protein